MKTHYNVCYELPIVYHSFVYIIIAKSGFAPQIKIIVAADPDHSQHTGIHIRGCDVEAVICQGVDNASVVV